ncbi:hypothetical protein [Lacticaseibacillus sp. N501-2]|uniref:hypothetical protein n=1 Tax=Lacticaseibacillus salsurae TaxID=3367729 RepID=UPI0038B24604
MVITTLFNHAARERRNVERLVLEKLAKNGYPETALLMEKGLQKADTGYRLDFETWETNEHYAAIATRDGKTWRVALQIGELAPQPLN